jgi:hypothetical protein
VCSSDLYNYFWEEFVNFLKTKFIVEEDTYYELANHRSYEITLLCGININLLECEMIIENKKTQEFVVLSISDSLTAAALNNQDNPLCKKVLISQFHRSIIKQHVKNEINFNKYFPWIYFPSNIFDLDSIYKERKNTTDFIDKFFFRGTSIEDRIILSKFNTEYFEGGLPIAEFDGYARILIKHKVALSISGRGEFCYRDIENFAIGTPILRFEFNNEMFVPLVPNFHYISVSRPSDLILDRLGEKHHANMLEKRFLEVKDDMDFLNFISDNARKYYENYLSINSSINLTYKILGLNEWE